MWEPTLHIEAFSQQHRGSVGDVIAVVAGIERKLSKRWSQLTGKAHRDIHQNLERSVP